MLNDKREDLKMKVEEALSRLLKSGKITQQEYDIFLNHYLSRNDEENILDELLKMFTETNFIRQKLFDIKNLKAYDIGNVNGEHVDMNASNISSYSINNMKDFEIDIIEVNDGAESEFTGVIPINVNFNEYTDTQEVSGGQSKSKQKTLSAHPGVHFGEDSGFMTFLLVIFLAGISSGIIFMIILNFLAK